MKQKRHQKIIEIIEQNDIETQEELALRLQNAGFRVTQATISRDIHELKLSKVPSGKGHQKYVALVNDIGHLGDKYLRILRDGLLSMDTAQNMLVIKTVSGLAMAVAAAVDAIHFQEIVGSIAGDDTIMVALKSAEDAERVMQKINETIA